MCTCKRQVHLYFLGGEKIDLLIGSTVRITEFEQ